MKQAIRNKIELICDRVTELNALLSSPQVINNQTKFRVLAQEHAKQTPLVDVYNGYVKAEKNLCEAKEMLHSDDSALLILAEEEVTILENEIKNYEQKLQTLLLPSDPNDEANIFIEIRAGAGGDEAAIFCGDLYRMYHRFAERERWNVEIINMQEGDHGGFKEIVVRIEGLGAYSKLKFESGAHRVQRVPETESQGRVHTSASTVVVLPEMPDLEEVIINKADIREDTFRASGAGGQHVNKTDSAIRLTHLPSGLVVECQDERSQHKNRARAYSLLTARLNDAQERTRMSEAAAERKSLVGTGDRSDRIRTYNFPQGRVTDHRINLTLYKLDEVIEGNLSFLIGPLVSEHQANLLASFQQ